MWKKIREALSGWKTYITGIGMVCMGVGMIVDGNGHIAEGLTALGLGLSTMTSRAAITKVDAKKNERSSILTAQVQELMNNHTLAPEEKKRLINLLLKEMQNG